jgi:hypothetical protein
VNVVCRLYIEGGGARAASVNKGETEVERMPKAHMTQEVAILTFFEEAPLDKAEMLFNIVKEKMRARRVGKEPAGMRKKNGPYLGGPREAAPAKESTTP